MSKASRREARQQWDTENPKLDAARRLRGIYYIASDDQEFDTVIKKARRKLETLTDSAMPCKAQGHSQRRRHCIIPCQPAEGDFLQKHSCGKHHAPKEDDRSNTVCGHQIDACSSRRCRIDEGGKQTHEDHNADRGKQFFESLQFSSPANTYSKNNDNSGSEGCSGQGMGQIQKCASSGRVQSKKQKRSNCLSA